MANKILVIVSKKRETEEVEQWPSESLFFTRLLIEVDSWIGTKSVLRFSKEMLMCFCHLAGENRTWYLRFFLTASVFVLISPSKWKPRRQPALRCSLRGRAQGGWAGVSAPVSRAHFAPRLPVFQPVRTQLSRTIFNAPHSVRAEKEVFFILLLKFVS